MRAGTVKQPQIEATRRNLTQLDILVLWPYTCVHMTFVIIQVAVSKFHEMRYNVAYVLKEMEDLEKRNILKLQD